jgi:glycosyltransferase involved in cell wall biosynthesis
MTGPAILVLTTVHPPDDTRIRERLIRSLEGIGHVTYATREPGPSDMSGLDWEPLFGGRIRRNLRACKLLVAPGWDLIILHDPETILAGILARFRRDAVVVFDVHEDLPAQIDSKERLPKWSRPLVRGVARLLYRLAERYLVLSLAEPGYQLLFEKPHPVFPNYPRSSTFPDLAAAGDGTAIYVGDITRPRGIEEAIAAAASAGVDLVAVGRVGDELAGSLQTEARSRGCDLIMTGYLPNPEALRRIAVASVGLSPLRDEANYRHSLPTKTLEYLAMGIPVVATNLPGTAAVLADLEAVWLIPPGDAIAMARAIEEAIQPGARVKAMAQAAELRRSFRWPEEEVRSFYSGLIDRAGNPSPN